MKAWRSVARVAAAGLALAAGGCATVEPWQRGALTRYGLRADRDVLQQAATEHAFFSREATTGGRSVGGSGCGCN